MKPTSFNDNWNFCTHGDVDKHTITLPHDAMIHETRLPDAPGGSAHGYFPGGIYVYEKTFTAPPEWAYKAVAFEFEGVYKNSTVTINGKAAGGCAYGYVPFLICADGLLNCGGENIITVTVDNAQLPNSRWYTGSGIYRPASLIVGSKTHIEWQGVQISTLSYAPARIRVDTKATGGEAAVEILYGGKLVASGKGASIELDIPDAKLWSDETPQLYTCHVTLSENDQVVDEVTEAFGIRKVEWSYKGLFVNGRETLLRGGCLHHDNGILGATTYYESEARRVRIMKEAGFNALRSSHNPASKAMLEACDKYGMYLMDETWDMWYSRKSRHDYALDFPDNYKNDIRALVERDFNHPSVIMYSIGNEVGEPGTEKGCALAKEMIALFHELDSTRAVTAGINPMIVNMAFKGKGMYKEEGGLNQSEQKLPASSTLFNMITNMVGTGMNKSGNSKAADEATSPILDALDIAGYNYASGRYPLDGKAHPRRVILGSETFPQDIAKNWTMVKRYPYLAGDFMWSAWDYLGEAGLGSWAYSADGASFKKPYPWLLSETGVFDILGNPTGEVFHAAAVWGILGKPAIAVQPVNHPGVRPSKMVWRGTNAIPSWSWRGCEGNKAVVEVYIDAASVELLLNGKRIGRKKVKECKVAVNTKYAPGTLTAIAYDQAGKELSRSELCSATGSIQLSVKPEEDVVKVGEIVYVPISLESENGVTESNADRKLSFAVEGGELLAFGSANPRTEERYDAGSFTTYYGRALAIVRATQSGNMTVTVTDGKNTSSVTIRVQ